MIIIIIPPLRSLQLHHIWLTSSPDRREKNIYGDNREDRRKGLGGDEACGMEGGGWKGGGVEGAYFGG